MAITFAARLEEALKKRDMKPAELSRKTKIPEGTISQYRKGAYVPKQKNLDKISKALNVTIDFLMGYDVPMQNNENPNKTLQYGNETETLTIDEKHHIKKYRLLDQHGQKAVDSVLDVEYERCSKANSPTESTREIYRAARSADNHEHTIQTRNASDMNKFENTPKVTSDTDL